jgi:two-component system OmpR family sensor kinase
VKMPEGHAPSPLSPRRWSVRWKLAGVSAGLTLLILLAFALVVGRLATNKINGEFAQDLKTTANQLATDFQLQQRNISGPNIVHLPLVGQYAVRIVNGAGEVQRILLPSGGTRVGETPNAPDLGAPEVDEVARHENLDVVSVPLATTSITGEPTFLQYARSRASVEDTIDRLWLFLAGGVLGGTILAALAGVAVARRAMRPIASLTATAREIAATRDPSQRVPRPESHDEVAELAETLDQMLRELDAARGESDQAMQAQRDFVADASHELRTPLTSILANLELLEESLASQGDSEDAEIVAGALGSSRRMRRLVADLLLLAQADAGRAGPRRSCDLNEIAAAAISEVRPVAGHHGIVLGASDPMTVQGNPDDLHRLVVNLVENGVRHTPPGSEVRVTISRGDGQAVLDVSDDGPGLPPALGDQIFARFVRGEGPADVAGSPGTGLGLAIVKAVAVSHGGDVEVGTSEAGGARFTVRLPLEARERELAAADTA